MEIDPAECCPVCDGHRLEIRFDRKIKFRYLGKDVVQEGVEHTVCLACGCSFNIPGQMARNNAAFYALEAQVVKGIAPRKILELRQKYGMTQAQAAKIFKCAKRAFSKWERGEVAPNSALANVLLLALEHTEMMRVMAGAAGEKLDLPVSPKLVPHEIVADLQARLAWRDLEEQRKIEAAYAAGQRDGALRHQVRVVKMERMFDRPAKGYNQDAYAKIEPGNDFIPQDLVIWQKEKQRALGQR